MRNRALPRRAWVVMVLVALGLCGAACTSSISGHGSADPATVALDRARADIDAVLAPVPPGAVQDVLTAWDRTSHPTPTQFVTWDYARTYRADELSQLSFQGLLAIDHRSWQDASGALDNDLVLAFRSPTGAGERFIAGTGDDAGDADLRPLTLTLHPPVSVKVRAFETTSADRYGYFRAIVYAQRGAVVAENFVGTPHRLDVALVISWSQTQVDHLR